MKRKLLFPCLFAAFMVDATVSLADDVVRVPTTLIGMPDVSAFTELDDLGIEYQISHSDEAICPEKAQFAFVHDVVPPVGTPLEGDKPLVILFTRPGEPTVPTPQVVGLSLDAARTSVEEHNLQMAVERHEAQRNIGMKCTFMQPDGYDGIIDSQDPLPLAPICPRSTIRAIGKEKSHVVRATNCIEP